MLKFAVSCGVGPSLRVLKRRAKDVTKLLKPHEPTGMLKDMADYMEDYPDSLISRVHIFPFGGIRTAAEYVARQVSGEG
jgi:methylenetetrahydrofolate reductase (NADPH)